MRILELVKKPKKGPELTATIAVFRKTAKGIDVLIGKRKNPPAAGEWALPGGHVKPGETSLEGALRELKEETGIDLHYLTLIGERPSEPDRSVVDVCYAAQIDPDYPVKASSDSAGSQWVNIGHLPHLAFDHDKYVYDSLSKIFGDKAVVKEVLKQCGDLLTEENKSKIHNLVSRHPKPKKGKLVVFEGMDGAGKSTQIRYLERWLKKQGQKVIVSCWNSSKVVKIATSRAKDKLLMTPLLFCLLNAADMAHRYDTEIVPALEAGNIVICDRYCYTSEARDGARGIDLDFIQKLYKQFREPDIIFYCQVPTELALERIGTPSYYEAGMDMGFSKDPKKSFIKYQNKVAKIYKKVLPTKKTNFITTTDEPKVVHENIKNILVSKLKL